MKPIRFSFFAIALVVWLSTAAIQGGAILSERHRARDLQNETLRLREQVRERLRLQTVPMASAAPDRNVSPDSASNALIEKASSQARAWAERVQWVKSELARKPTARIPEMDLLTETDWLTFAIRADQRGIFESPESELRSRLSFIMMREQAKSTFSFEMSKALRAYLSGSQQRLPNDLRELKGYGGGVLTESRLARYELVRTGSALELPAEETIIREKRSAIIDPELEATFEVHLDGTRMVPADERSP
jgi:hypothetical protein